MSRETPLSHNVAQRVGVWQYLPGLSAEMASMLGESDAGGTGKTQRI